MSAFLDLHVPGRPLLLANAWDVGSAKILETLEFRALATTSSGFAATLGRPDMAVSRDEAIAHAASIVASVGVPVSGDLENGFADDPQGVADTIRRGIDAGLAGASIEDATGVSEAPLYPAHVAVERVAAAVEAARVTDPGFVITARAENHLWGVDSLADTIARLQGFQDAGAHVLYAPGLTTAEQIRTVLAEVGRPLNVLALPGTPSVAELADLGVARISVGGAFTYAAYSGLVDAANELRTRGTYGYLDRMRAGRQAARAAFG